MAVRVLESTSARRGLYAALVELAILLGKRPEVKRGCLVLWRCRLSRQRAKAEWDNALNVLDDRVAQRLAIVYVDQGTTWMEPADALNEQIAEVFRLATEEGRRRHGLEFPVRPRPRQKLHEVFKILLIRWLRGDGPIPLGRLCDEVGCSRPTVRKALERDSLRDAVAHASNRSVTLKMFPRAAWNELLALTREIRNTFQFRDQSGGQPDPEALLRRTEKANVSDLGVSGVFAARHWHPNFNLHGSPRLDLILHAPDGRADLRFVKRVDPALALDEERRFPAALVIHVIDRATSQFAPSRDGGLPWADPVETALDLHEMSLTGQANQLLTHLRPEARLA